jgi:DNA-binding PucR family transcriptional regulator
MGRGGVVAFEDLGIQRLLLQVPDLGELQAFAADVLGGLLETDPASSPGPDARAGAAGARRDLLGTLVAWFDANGSPQRTARKLHVHPNTVAYRIRRIEEVTGLRLDHARDRLMAQVALEITRSLGGGA